jgi:hypothetical protein
MLKLLFFIKIAFFEEENFEKEKNVDRAMREKMGEQLKFKLFHA